MKKANNESGSTNVNIGKAKEAETTLNISETLLSQGKYLVPVDRYGSPAHPLYNEPTPNYVTFVNHILTINWTESTATATGITRRLQATVLEKGFKRGENKFPTESLVNVTVNQITPISLNTPITLNVRVELNIDNSNFADNDNAVTTFLTTFKNQIYLNDIYVKIKLEVIP